MHCLKCDHLQLPDHDVDTAVVEALVLAFGDIGIAEITGRVKDVVGAGPVVGVLEVSFETAGLADV